MDSNPPVPDYQLDDRLALTSPAQVRALGNPVRTTILGMLHERAATVTELAAAVDRPKSTVAHHVKVLTDAGLLRVVRTRRVRAIEERFYGRLARVYYVPAEPTRDGEQMSADFNDLEVAAQESAGAFRDGLLWGFIRHARLPQDRVDEFWQRMAALVQEFDELPRSGGTVYGFALGIYPTDHPRLPDVGAAGERGEA